jgi:argininosuccinate lyase
MPNCYAGEIEVSQKAWGGVFQEGTDARVEKFTESVSFDQRLYAHDIQASIAHAEMLTEVGLLDEGELAQIRQGLSEIKQQIEAGEFPYSAALEDIHMHIERALIEKIGDVGRKLHTARSRNDQVSTDFRLWCRDAIDRVDAALITLQTAFVGRADGDRDVILPAYTHLKRAQPVLAPHYWLCYCEKYQRDRRRLADCRARVN